MFAFFAAGVLGVGLPFKGNVDVERELHPSERGWAFVRKTVARAKSGTGRPGERTPADPNSTDMAPIGGGSTPRRPDSFDVP